MTGDSYSALLAYVSYRGPKRSNMNTISIRRWHSYIGLFTAPSVLFFALTGAVQLYNLHEAHGDYKPPAVVEKLSTVHKDQEFALGDHHEPPPQADAAAPAAADDNDVPKTPTALLKAFFLVVALSLTASTSLGLWIGLTQTRNKRLAWVLLIAGAVIPVALLMF